MTDHETEYYYMLLEAGHLNLMYLPSGAVAWLFDQPEPQITAAEQFGVMAKDSNPVIDACVLRADPNILILTCEAGQKFRVYPDGGYSFDGQPMGLEGCQRVMSNVPEHECGCGGNDQEMVPAGDTDGLMDVASPEGFTNMARTTEDAGGETNLVPHQGTSGIAAPYTDVATDIINNMDMFSPDDMDGWDMGSNGYTDEDMDEISRAMGTYEFNNESIKLDQDRLTFDEVDTLDLPRLEVGDEMMVGKFKNRKATMKGFTKDKHNQPVAKTDKGDQQIFKGRIKKLMTD
jgi:hypothetical protein